MAGTAATPVVPLQSLPLRTEGRWILDNQNQRFRLKCVNWYGASGELHVVHGLHKRTMQELVSTIVDWGFNCVRLPFSLENYFSNPPVPAHALRADPLGARGNVTGMEAYDAAVAAITGAGLLVIVDNHSSESGWCCEADALDGVWFTDHYPETRWIEALAAMARRYRNNSRVVAVELRNEVRDAGVNQVVWGTGDAVGGNVLADWPSAAERAGNAVLAENPSALVLVTGLCYGQDLRGAVDRPVQLSVPGRLVWTSHSYHWYFWWHDGMLRDNGTALGAAALALSLMLLLAGAALCARAWRAGRRVTTPQAFLEVSLGFVFFLGVVLTSYSVGTRHIYAGTACADLGARAAQLVLVPGIILLAGCFGCMLLAVALRLRQRSRRRKMAGGDTPDATPGSSWSSRARSLCSAHSVPVLFWLSLAFGAVAFFFLSTPSYWLVKQQLDRHWGFALEEGHAYTAPVVLGELGTNRDDAFWQALVRYVGEKDLDFSYWPFNGQKWDHDRDRWTQETYGLLDSSWRRPRYDWLLPSVIGGSGR